VLAAAAGPGDLAHLTLRFVEAPPRPCDGADLEALRRAVPAGRALPLLQALAVGRHGPLVLDYLDGLGLEVTVADPGTPA
ncbi:MAG: 3-oxoacyl-ACP synthase, partial [Ideonella sp.]|nr:3-oxoacyl-ACP synthase [Ideonella sp.]